MIHDWADLVKIFVENLQGTYVRPRNSWDLRSCRQKLDESLPDFIRRFSKQCTELPNITDSDVIGAFIAGTTCKELVHELGHKTPMSTSQLLDIATNFASGEEAVGAIFSDCTGKRKQKAEATEASGSCDPKMKKKGRKGKQGQSDDNLVDVADRKNPKRAPAGPGLLDEILKKPCPYHRGPTKHTLEECTVLRRYYTDIIIKEGTEEPPKDDDPQGEGFPKVKNCLLIFGGRAARLTASQRKRKLREVCAVSTAAPSYLKWSESAITFDRQDHPDRIPNPRSYPLIVEPIITETRLTKVLMDGGSSLNILYAETLALMGINKSRLRNDASLFHGVVPGHRAHPLGQIDLPVYFGTLDNFRREVLVGYS